MPVLPWRSAESEAASGSLDAEPDRPCTQSVHASVALDRALEPLEADRRCTHPGHASVALDHASELLEAGRGTASQHTPVCMRRPSQALVEEMLESPVTVSKPLPQPEGASCFRRQSSLGMQGLTTDSVAQYPPSTDLHVRRDRQGSCCAIQAQPDSQVVEAAVVDAKPAKCNDHNSEAMPDIRPLTAVCTSGTVWEVGPADASKSAQNSMASECRQMGAQIRQADASEASCNAHATDDFGAVTKRGPVTAATEQQPASQPAAAVHEQQSQQEQYSVRLDLGGGTGAEPQPHTKANAADSNCGASDQLNALTTGMYTRSSTAMLLSH